ncbi:MAG: PAS domain-containing protein [Anaerolineae bacterium]|nr:PAS domain-containing protein [Anaerolineae bacterium]
MNGQLAFVILILFISFLLALGIAAFSWQRRHAGSWAYPFVLVALAAAWWSFFYALELVAPTLAGKLLWAKIEYFAIVIIPVLWFLFGMAYTGRQKWLSLVRIFLLLIIPAITLFLLYTNEHHRLIWFEIPLAATGYFPTLAPDYGIWFWVHSGYSYLLLAIGTIVLIQTAFRSPKTYRWQNMALVAGALFPWLANIIYLLNLSVFPNIDLSPVAFSLSGLVLTWSIFRFHLFDVVPVARQVAVETVRDGMIVLDDKKRIVDMNPAAQAVFEVNLANVIGRTIDELLVNWPELVNSFKDVLEVETEIQIAGEGGDLYYELQISPLLNSRKRVNGRLIVFHDITSYKETEAALAEARDQALAASRVKTELLARVSHELRTPLNVILGFSEMIQLGITGTINEKQYETLDKILDSTRFLTKQVNDLLDLSSIEAGTTKLHNHTFSIIEVIDEVIVKWQAEAESKSLQIAKLNPAEALETVYGDREGVTQILTNLVGNAIKFSDKGSVQISAFAFDEQFWALQVSDEGPGIPPEAHDLIFEPFRQIDGSMTRIHGGTGLGLTIVKQMTELMGGWINLTSNVGQGSTFTVILPNEQEATSSS